MSEAKYADLLAAGKEMVAQWDAFYGDLPLGSPPLNYKEEKLGLIIGALRAAIAKAEPTAVQVHDDDGAAD